MSGHRTPRSTDAATRMLERFAELDGQIAAIDAARNDAIVAANARADEAGAALLEERAQIMDKLRPWWVKAGAALTRGARKSIELGGCIIGTRQGREALTIAGDEERVALALKARRWAAPLVRTRVSLDRRAVLLSLDGLHGPQLKELGLGKRRGDEEFYVLRCEQQGTLASVQP